MYNSFLKLLTSLIMLALLGSLPRTASADHEQRAPFLGHHVPEAVATARLVKRAEPGRQIRLTFVLPLRDPQGRADLLKRLYDPTDPLYRHYLTVQEFTSRFAPPMESVNAVARFAMNQGLSIDEISSNRMTITVHGPSSSVERAFQVHLHDYVAQDGTCFRAPDREPTLPASITAKLLDVKGFDDLPTASPNLRRVPPLIDSLAPLPDGSRHNYLNGSGPNGFLSPSDVQTIYSLNGVSAKGQGETIGLFELDGYTNSDITEYEHEFYPGFPRISLQNVLVDGFDGKPQTTSGASEVTLDIDMMLAVAPSVSKIIVYEGDNSTAGLIAAYNRIASDDAASVVSSSWGLSEVSANFFGQITPEGQVFEEMAMQGQTMLAASGDAGAYGDSWSLVVDDPASQPFVTGVGGTDLTTTPSAQYISESAWGDPSDTYGLRPRGQGGGGGVSGLQTRPDYQKSVGVAGSSVSTTMRNVPDVSLYGDYDTGGYAVYLTDPANPAAGGQWGGYNGTSASSPLWAGFIALVNQGRAQAGRAPIGFLNPALYTIGKYPAAYVRDFHDIDNGTTNLYYPAVTGYDLATGWGSFIGTGLYADLVSSLTIPVVSSVSPGTGSAGQSVAISGSGFTGATSVVFDGVPSADFTVSSDSRLIVTIPAGAKTGPIAVANAFGTGSSSASFVITPGVSPVITSITPSNAPTGAVISILGRGFTGTTLVTVGGVSVAFTVVSDAKIVFTVPAGLRGGTVAVTTPKGTTESQSRVGVPVWAAANVAAVHDGTARILWIRSDGAAGVWSMDVSNHSVAVGPTYGPYTQNGSAWYAMAIAAAPDGTTRLLWDRGDGAAGVWALNSSGNVISVGQTYGPYVDSTGKWTAYGITVEPDGTTRLLWTRSDYAMGVWTLSALGSMTRVGPTYGPYPDGIGGDWSAIGIAGAAGGSSHVLWMRSDGAMGVWNFDSANQETLTGPVYGPYSDSGGDWSPLAIGVSSDGLSHVLWGRSDGAAGIWSLDPSEDMTQVGPTYGPYPEFSPFGFGVAGEESRLLWVRNDRAAGLWTMNSDNQETLIGTTYGPF